MTTYRSITPTEEDNGSHEDEQRGLSVFTGSLTVLGTLIGVAALAMPKAVVQMGSVGLAILVVWCLIALYTAVRLVQCWNIIEEKYDVKGHVQDPYPMIGYYAFGDCGRYLVSISNDLTLLGLAVILTVVGGGVLHDIVENIGFSLSFCYWIMVFIGTVLPFMWIGTPKDLWVLSLIAASSSLLACILLFTNTLLLDSKLPPAKHTEPSLQVFALAFGKVTAGVVCHMFIPTIHVDMKERKSFTGSVVYALLIMIVIYFSVAAAGYFVLGDSVDDNLMVTINRLDKGWMIYTVQGLLLAHLSTAIVLSLNPLFQDMEKTFHVENEFSWKRVVLRTIIVLVLVFIAETLPRFGNILSLFGSTLFSLQAYILPLIFHEKLSSVEKSEDSSPFPIYKRIMNYCIILVAVLTTVIGTYSGALETFGTNWVPPCYVNITEASAALS